jgi:hypothetical protein
MRRGTLLAAWMLALLAGVSLKVMSHKKIEPRRGRRGSGDLVYRRSRSELAVLPEHGLAAVADAPTNGGKRRTASDKIGIGEAA